MTLDGVRYDYPRFLRPTGALPPRVFRLGAKLLFKGLVGRVGLVGQVGISFPAWPTGRRRSPHQPYRLTAHPPHSALEDLAPDAPVR